MVPQTIVTTKDVSGNALSVPPNSEMGFAITAPPKGRLNRFVVTQLTGSTEGFTATLYDLKAACPPGASPSSNATEPETLHRIAEPLTVATSNASGAAFNLDSHYGGKSTAGQQVLYLKIATAGATGAARTFGVALVVTSPYAD